MPLFPAQPGKKKSMPSTARLEPCAGSRVSTGLWFLLAMLFAGSAVAEERFGDSLVVVVSGGLRGRAAGCGCSAGPQGGLDRRATLLNRMLGSVLPIGFDCGGVLDLDPEGGMQRSRCTIAGLARQGVKVLGVTSRDLYYGPKFLRDATDKSGVILVSGNLHDETGRPAFPTWSVVESNGLKLSVTSLCQSIPALSVPGGMSAAPMDSTLLSLRGSKPASDICFLLTDLGEAELRSLLLTTDLFNVAITSSRQIFTATPFSVGHCLVYHPEPDGRAAELLILPGLNPSNGRALKEAITLNTPPDPETEKWLKDCLGSTPNK